ncbi:MAG: hypothetical protein ABJA82_02950 [Myxococcales bacterium]
MDQKFVAVPVWVTRTNRATCGAKAIVSNVAVFVAAATGVLQVVPSLDTVTE